MGRGAGKGGDGQQWLNKERLVLATAPVEVKDVNATATYSMEVGVANTTCRLFWST